MKHIIQKYSKLFIYGSLLFLVGSSLYCIRPEAMKANAAEETTRNAVAKEVGIEKDGDNVYWTFSFENTGYSVNDYEFFDGSTTFSKTGEIVDGVASFKLNVTSLESSSDGKTYYPHLRLDGVNYQKDGTTTGDIKVTNISFNEYDYVTVDNKVYYLEENWNMPSLKIINVNEDTKVANKKEVTIENINDKVYWNFSFYIFGYDGSTFTIFDENKWSCDFENENSTNFLKTFSIDVTDWEENKSFYPHLKIDGTLWGGDSSGSGNISGESKDSDGSILDSSIFNSKRYDLVNEFQMRCLKITSLSESNANIEFGSKFAEVKSVHVELEGSTVYWTFYILNIGYEPSDYIFFDNITKDGKTTISEYETTYCYKDGLLCFKIDVTKKESGVTLYPHLSIEGVNYSVNGNATGDILCDYIEYTDGEYVKAGEKMYVIAQSWYMPSLKVIDALSGEALSLIDTATIERIGNKIYWKFQFWCFGYDFSNTTLTIYDSDWSFKFGKDGTSLPNNVVIISLLCDVTDKSNGTYWPHLKIDDTNWGGGNGDIKGASKDGNIVDLGEKNYQIKAQWEMPSLVITDRDSTSGTTTNTSIKVTNLPNKTSYNLGDTLDISGLVVKYGLNNGNDGDEITDYTYAPTTLTKLGENTITVYKNYMFTTFTVNVGITKSTNSSSFTISASTEGLTTFDASWASSNSDVAKVEGNRLSATIDTKVAGETTITMSVKNTSYSNSFTLTVVDALTKVTSTDQLTLGKKYTFANNDSSKVISKETDGNRSALTTNLYEGNLESTSNMGSFILLPAGKNKYAFYDEDAQKLLKFSEGKLVTTGEYLDEDAYFTIEFNDNVPTIKAGDNEIKFGDDSFKNEGDSITLWLLNNDAIALGDTWAIDFNNTASCDATGASPMTSEKWQTLKTHFESMSLVEKMAASYLDTSLASNSFKEAVHNYEHCVSAYNLDAFLSGRAVTSSSNNSYSLISNNQNIALIVVVAISLIGVTSVIGYALIRKQKEQ